MKSSNLVLSGLRAAFLMLMVFGGYGALASDKNVIVAETNFETYISLEDYKNTESFEGKGLRMGVESESLSKDHTVKYIVEFQEFTADEPNDRGVLEVERYTFSRAFVKLQCSKEDYKVLTKHGGCYDYADDISHRGPFEGMNDEDRLELVEENTLLKQCRDALQRCKSIAW